MAPHNLHPSRPSSGASARVERALLGEGLPRRRTPPPTPRSTRPHRRGDDARPPTETPRLDFAPIGCSDEPSEQGAQGAPADGLNVVPASRVGKIRRAVLRRLRSPAVGSRLGGAPSRPSACRFCRPRPNRGATPRPRSGEAGTAARTESTGVWGTPSPNLVMSVAPGPPRRFAQCHVLVRPVSGRLVAVDCTTLGGWTSCLPWSPASTSLCGSGGPCGRSASGR